MRSHSGNLIFCQVHTEYGNLGDVVITTTLLRLLRCYGDVVVNDVGIPEWFAQQLRIAENERASRSTLPFSLLVLAQSILYLLGTGRRVYFVTAPGHFFGTGARCCLTRLAAAAYFGAARILGVRTCNFGYSIGPFSKMVAVAERARAAFMYFYSVRDTMSERYARQIGIKRAKIFPDLAWLMESRPAAQKAATADGSYVVFSFRDCVHPLSKSDTYKEALLRVLDRIVAFRCEKGVDRLVVSYQVGYDYPFCREIAQRYSRSHDVVFLERKIDTRTMTDVYSRASLIFSNRLHVLLFGIICGSVPVAVTDASEHHKIAGLLADIGMSRLFIDTRRSDRCIEILRGIAMDSERIKEQLLSIRHRTVEYAEAVLRRVMRGEL